MAVELCHKESDAIIACVTRDVISLPPLFLRRAARSHRQLCDWFSYGSTAGTFPDSLPSISVFADLNPLDYNFWAYTMMHMRWIKPQTIDELKEADGDQFDSF